MSEFDQRDNASRRTILKCMTWAGTGVLWTMASGVPRSLGIIDQAIAAEQKHGLTFLQISDSHVGFDKPANPNALGTLEEAIAKIKSLPVKPSFMIHTGDITHLSKPAEFDNADRVIGRPVSTCIMFPASTIFSMMRRSFIAIATARMPKVPAGTASTPNGVHFIGLVNVVNLKAGGLGNLGHDQLEWLEDDLHGRSAARRSWCSPTFRCGPSIRNGAGAPRTVPARSNI